MQWPHSRRMFFYVGKKIQYEMGIFHILQLLYIFEKMPTQMGIFFFQNKKKLPSEAQKKSSKCQLLFQLSVIKDCFFKATMEFVNVKVVHPSSLESSNLKRQNTGKVLIKNEFVKLKLLQITHGPWLARLAKIGMNQICTSEVISYHSV